MTITRFSTGQKGDSALIGNISFSASDMEWISTIRVGSGGGILTFSNIPQEYKHLQLRMMLRNYSAPSTGGDAVAFIYNGDSTGTNYWFHYLSGSGSAASSGSGQGGTYNKGNIGYATRAGDTASAFGVTVADILDYSNSSKYTVGRGLAGFDGNGTGNIWLWSHVWNNTAAVNSITVQSVSGTTINFAQYSKVSLYGIRG